METLIQKDKYERLAAATSTTEVLTQLNVTIDTLPQKSQQNLLRSAEGQNAMGMKQLDPISMSLQHTKLISDQLEDKYQILKLKQKDEMLQVKIDRNTKFIDELRTELECSKTSLMKRNPNPETVQEVIRQLKQKVASYEESYERAKVKFSKLPVSDNILPKSLLALVETLAGVREEASRLQVRAEDVALARQARHTLATLRR